MGWFSNYEPVVPEGDVLKDVEPGDLINTDSEGEVRVIRKETVSGVPMLWVQPVGVPNEAHGRYMDNAELLEITKSKQNAIKKETLEIKEIQSPENKKGHNIQAYLTAVFGWWLKQHPEMGKPTVPNIGQILEETNFLYDRDSKCVFIMSNLVSSSVIDEKFFDKIAPDKDFPAVNGIMKVCHGYSELLQTVGEDAQIESIKTPYRWVLKILG